MSFDEFDKETGSSDGLQPMQAGLSCVYSLNEAHFHKIHVVPKSYMVKDKQEKDEIGSKPGKNGKRDEAGRSQK
nr:hypothetical protein [Tanacetum cinerariifolium]